MRALISLLGMLVLLCLPASAAAAECTDTWVGPESGKWVEAEAWSAEHVPTETDVACIPKSHRVTVDSGAQRAETLQGEGELVITEASLSLVGVAEASNIGTLRLKEGGELGGTGELWVVNQLVALGGLMKGDGYTKLGAEATGEVVGGEFGGQPGLRLEQKRVLSVHGSMDVRGEEGELRVVEGALLGVVGTFNVHGSTGKVALRESAGLLTSGTVDVEGGLNVDENAELVNSGEFTIAGSVGRLVALEGGRIENEGTLKVNSEGPGTGVLTGESPLLTPHLKNTGTVVKTQGTETSSIEVPIDNEGLVKTETGILLLTGGGASGQEGHSEWVAQSENLYAAQTKIVFALQNFSLGEEATIAGEMQILSGGGVTADGISAKEGSVWLYGGSLHLLKGHPKVFKELGVAAGRASIDAGSELWAEYVEVTDAYLESSGAGELKEPAEISSGAESKIQAESFYQSLGSVQMGNKATFNGDFVSEGGAFVAGDETVFSGEFFHAKGSFVAGSSTQFLFEKPFAAGAFEIGPGSTVKGKYFWQEAGNLTVGPSTTFTDDFVWLAAGTTTFGEDVTFELSEIFYQEAAASTFGSGDTVHANEWVYFEEGSTSFAPGASLKTGTVFVQSELVKLEAGSEIVADQLELYEGEVTGSGSIVTGKLGWWSTVMSGKGTTEVLNGGKLGHSTTCGTPCVYSPKYATLRERELILRGEFTTDINTLGMADGAKLVNYGTFDSSSEEAKWGSEIQIAPESSSNPIIVNRGNFEKQTGSGTTYVDVPFKNLGHVGRREGTLSILRPIRVPGSEKFGRHCNCGDPVDTATGNFSESQSDLAIGGRGIGLDLTRAYSAQEAAAATSPGPFGYGWSGPFGDRLTIEGAGADVTLTKGNGNTVPFTRTSGSAYAAPAWSQETLSGSPEAGYTFTTATQTQFHFSGSGQLESVVNRNGNQTTLAYESGRLKTVTDPAGRHLTFAYNPSGEVESVTDPMGHVVKYAYEGGNLTSVTMPGEAAPRWRFKYDGSHRITEIINGRGGKTTNEYDSESRVVSQTDPAGRTLTFKYEGFHTIVTNKATGAVTDQWFNSDNEPFQVTRGYGTPQATTETFTYDEGGRTLSRTDGLSHTTTYGYDEAGNRTSEKDPLGHETKWAYDAAHDLVSTTTPRGETTTIARDSHGNVESVSRPAPGGATQTTSFKHNAFGELESITDPLEHVWSFGYDEAGDRTSETDPLGHKTTLGYDGDSRLVSIVSPRGNLEGAKPSEYETTVERDPQGRPLKVTDPLGHATEYAYDGNGNLASLTDAKGHTTKFTYNADDERTKVEKPNGATLETGYDGAGYVTSQTDGNGKTTTYLRNVLEQPVEVIDPLGRKTTESFDAAGDVAKVTDPASREATYAYDNAGHLTGVNYSEAATPDTSFEYDADGNVTAMHDGSGESTFAYDQLGRLTRSQDGHGAVVEYGYDLGEEQTGVVYPNGKGVSRKYDAAGRLESVTDWLGGVTGFSYDADSNLKNIAFPSGSGNVDEYAYDRASRISEARFKKGSETLASLTYTRDALGQVEKEARSGLPGPAETTFGYDANNRLTKAGAAAYEYDKADNLTSAPGTTNAYDAASQLQSGTHTTYAYDKLGERTSSTTRTPEAPGFLRTFGGAGSGPGNLSAPADTATDAEGNVWVADAGHNRVQEFNAKGEYLRQFGTAGTGNGQFTAMHALATDAKGNLWVAAANRVQEFNAKGEYLRQFGTAGGGNGQFFEGLTGLAVDPEGHVWTLESSNEAGVNKPRLQEFTSEGAFLTKFEFTSGKENGQLKNPQALAIDAAGNLWVADTGNNRIEEFSSKGTFLRASGSEGTGNGQFKSPLGIATDSSGNVWVTDTGNNRIEELSSNAVYLAQVGKSGANNGQFSEPRGLTVDANGNVWVADAGNNRVEEIAGGAYVRQAGGEGSGPGNLSAPADTATDAEGNVWVADAGHNRVQEFNPKGEFLSQFGGTGTGNGQFTAMHALAFDAKGNLWVAAANRVQEFNSKGQYLRQFGTLGAGNGQFFEGLTGLAVDPEGHLWTLESSNELAGNKPRLQEFTSEGAFLAKFEFTYGKEAGQLKSPQALATDAAGNLWVTDTGNNRIEEFSPKGVFLRTSGSEGTENGQFKSPKGIAIDSSGNVWVTDTGNNRIQELSSTGVYLAQFGKSGDNNGQFSEPKGLALDSGGNVWVADSGNNRVEEIAGGAYVRQAGGTGSGPGNLSAPADTATDAEGNVWVADAGHNRVQEFNPKAEFLSQFGATGTGNGQFREPRGIAVSPANGHLYVADGENYRVQELTPEGVFVRKWSVGGELRDLTVDAEGHVWTVEGGGGFTPRVQEFTSEGALIRAFGKEGSEAGQFKSPEAIATDKEGNVWVADTGNNRLQEFSPTGTFIRKWGTAGSAAGQLTRPRGLAFDSEGKLWVADSGNDRFERFSPEGTYLATFGAPGNNSGQFAEPRGVAIDASGNIWVADTGNDRVQEWQTEYTTAYGYDQAGDLTSVQRPAVGGTAAINQSLAYDATGLLVSKTTGVTTRHFAWDSSTSLPLLLNDGQNSYVYGPNGLPIEQISSGEKPTYLHHDQLGSTRLLTDASGNTTATYSYQPFGALEAKTGTATIPLSFAGQYTDAETGLQYLRARFYDPETAQFLTRDPLEALTRQPYSYGLDNPLQYSDPSGMFVEAGAAAAPEVCAGPQVVLCAGGGAALCAAEAACRNVAAELAEDARNVLNSIFGGDDSSSSPVPPKSTAEQEYDEARGFCPEERLPDLPNFDDPSQAPGAEWEWRGNGPPGSDKGAWYNPETQESLHPDLDHPDPVEPHFDWISPTGKEYRIYPDGEVEAT